MLHTGNVRLRTPPQRTDAERTSALQLLEAAFREHRLTIAGPALDCVPEILLATAEFAAWACWFLVHRGEPAREVERALTLSRRPVSAADHLSGDVVLRLLPPVHRRARALDPQDVLTRRLEQLLRQWPLSGVLADLDEGPSDAVDLGGHPGLCLLYAERLADRRRPGWVMDGPTRPYIELVFAERGIRGLP
jgi:hypothetical protein